MKTVIILGSERDYHAQHMLQRCQKRGIDAALFDTSQFPHRDRISIDPNYQQSTLHLQHQSIDFSEICSVFWSSVCPTHKHSGAVTDGSMVAYHDAYSVLRCFFDNPSCRWVNSWQAYDFHRLKPRQLALAKSIGVTIPETYIGNDPLLAKQFIEQHEQVVFKPVYGGAHAALVDRKLVGMEHLQAVLRQSPVTLQRFIKGTNVRTYCIGEDVFSATLDSEHVDFRTEPGILPKACTTPSQVALQSRKINQFFGLQWSAIDWRVDEHGEFVFLEANPSPMFIHFEQHTQYPITSALIELLVGATRASESPVQNQLGSVPVHKSFLLSTA